MRSAAFLAALACATANADTAVFFRQADGGGAAVDDAYIWAGYPNNNGGGSTVIYTSYPSHEKQGLLRFELRAEIPPTAKVTRATLELQSDRSTGEEQRLHRVLVPWIEREVSWTSFDAGFDPAVEFSFVPVAGTNSLDITGVVHGWVGGSGPNYGVLIEHGTVWLAPPAISCRGSRARHRSRRSSPRS